MAKTKLPALPADLADLARELPPFLSNGELAEMLGASPRTPEAWRARGEGPPHVCVSGGMVRYERGALLRWLAERMAATPGNGGAAEPRT